MAVVQRQRAVTGVVCGVQRAPGSNLRYRLFDAIAVLAARGEGSTGCLMWARCWLLDVRAALAA
jgi:hypothetical protein